MRRHLLVSLAAVLLAAPAAAQSASHDASDAAEPARVDAVRPLPTHLVPSAPTPADAERDGAVVSHRPWWRIPLIGAGVGLGLGLLAPNCSEGGDYTICIPPEAAGVVWGAAAGALVEGLMQSWVDHRPRRAPDAPMASGEVQRR